MTTKQSLASRYDAANMEAATIIASDPEKYPDGSLMARWADLILSRAVGVKDDEAGPLFRQRVA